MPKKETHIGRIRRQNAFNDEAAMRLLGVDDEGYNQLIFGVGIAFLEGENLGDLSTNTKYWDWWLAEWHRCIGAMVELGDVHPHRIARFDKVQRRFYMNCFENLTKKI